MPSTETLPVEAPPITPMVRHFVEKRRGAGPTDVDYQDKTLCGKPWDRLFVSRDGPICEDCVTALKRRLGGR